MYAEFKCNSCNGTEKEIIKTPRLTHYAKVQCFNCKKFVKWIPRQENENGRRRTSKFKEWQVFQFHEMKAKICFFCGRTKERLGEKETFTIDHINQLTDDGEDILPNLQILCTSCHKLKNWTILYMNKHHEGKNDTTI